MSMRFSDGEGYAVSGERARQWGISRLSFSFDPVGKIVTGIAPQPKKWRNR